MPIELAREVAGAVTPGENSGRRHLKDSRFSDCSLREPMFTLVAASGVLLGDRVLLGSHIAVLTGVEPASSLPASDALLARGAAVTLVVPLPQSGLASSSTTTTDAALRLLLRISRGGMSRLQTALDYANCDPRSLVAGNRPLMHDLVKAIFDSAGPPQEPTK